MRHAGKRLKFYLSWPGLWLYFASGWRARVVVRDAEGRWLLVQGKWRLWYDDPGFSLPGGGIQRGEDPAAAAVRELAEELGLHIEPGDLRPIGQTRVREYGIRYEAQLFMVTVPAGVPLKLEAREIVSARWYRPAELGHERLKPDVRRALELVGGHN